MNRRHIAAVGIVFGPGLLALISANCGSNPSGTPSGFDGGGVDAGRHDTGFVIHPTDSMNLMGGDGMSGADACAVQTATAAQSPLDLYFMIDRSGSMAYNNSWIDEIQALNTFFSDVNSSGIGVGLGYMPQADLCNTEAYTPSVPISPLPGMANSQQALLTTSLANTEPFGACPTTVGLEGAVAAAKANQIKNPSHTTVIVFPSDGTHINGCEVVPDGGLINSTANALSVLSAAAALSPPIRTFVIGILPQARMDDYAVAGGTGKAFLLGVSDGGITDADLTDALDPLGFVPGAQPDAAIVSIEGPLIAAFNAIRSQALPCTYSIPQASSGTIDYSNVNVRFTPNGGSGQQFYGVNSESDCTTATPNWYYQNNDAGSPASVALCPNACSLVKTATTGSVKVDYGCQTIAPPK